MIFRIVSYYVDEILQEADLFLNQVTLSKKDKLNADKDVAGLSSLLLLSFRMSYKWNGSSYKQTSNIDLEIIMTIDYPSVHDLKSLVMIIWKCQYIYIYFLFL